MMKPTMHHKRPTIVVGLLAFLAGMVTAGCHPLTSDELGPDPVGPAVSDLARLKQEIHRRVGKAFESKAINEQYAVLITTIAEDPQVSKAGDALVEAIGSTPQIQRVFGKLMTAVGESPAVQATLQELRVQNPHSNEEQLVAAFVRRVEINVESRAFDKGLDSELSKLMEQPEVIRVFEKVGSRVAENLYIEEAIDASLGGLLTDEKLTELNGGKEPDAERTIDLLLEHVFTEKRFEQFFVELIGRVAASKHFQQAAAEFLSAPSVQTHVVTAVGTVLSDPTFQKDAIDVLILIMGDPLTEEQVATAAGKLTTNPVTKKALVTLLEGLLNDPTVEQVGDKLLRNISSDPAFREAITRFVAGW